MAINIWDALFYAIGAVKEKYDSKIEKINQDMRSLAMRQYTPRELTEFTWQELSDIAKNGTAADNNIMVGDYKTVTVEDNTVIMHVAGIDIHTGIAYDDSNKVIGHHIDFISRDCYPYSVIWQKDAPNNNGTASKPHPYLATGIMDYLNNTLFHLLPSDLSSVIIDRNVLLELRYSSGEVLTDSYGWNWANVGKLWVPTEYEVFGQQNIGTERWSIGLGVRYPIFERFPEFRVKHGSASSTIPTGWWVATPCGGESSEACYVTQTGIPDFNDASTDYEVPVCFRLGQPQT